MMLVSNVSRKQMKKTEQRPGVSALISFHDVKDLVSLLGTANTLTVMAKECERDHRLGLVGTDLWAMSCLLI